MSIRDKYAISNRWLTLYMRRAPRRWAWMPRWKWIGMLFQVSTPWFVITIHDGTVDPDAYDEALARLEEA